MSCDAADRRSFRGWLALLGLVALAGFYAYVLTLVRGRTFDEGYRRTFMTREFAINPRADGYGPAGGLGLDLGARIDLVAERRFHERFAWTRTREDGAFLIGASGRLFFALADARGAAGRAHRLELDLRCDLPAAVEVRIAVDGVAVGAVACGAGAARATFELPAGTIDARRFHEIAVARPVETLAERLATATGLRARALEVRAMRLDAVDPP